MLGQFFSLDHELRQGDCRNHFTSAGCCGTFFYSLCFPSPCEDAVSTSNSLITHHRSVGCRVDLVSNLGDVITRRQCCVRGKRRKGDELRWISKVAEIAQQDEGGSGLKRYSFSFISSLGVIQVSHSGNDHRSYAQLDRTELPRIGRTRCFQALNCRSCDGFK